MSDMAIALSGFPAQILEHNYNYESFGSWWFSFRFKGQEFRLVFDGKDAQLSLKEKTASDWKEIASDQTKHPNATNMISFIREAIKRC